MAENRIANGRVSMMRAAKRGQITPGEPGPTAGSSSRSRGGNGGYGSGMPEPKSESARGGSGGGGVGSSGGRSDIGRRRYRSGGASPIHAAYSAASVSASAR